jgi:hypothetical protein
MPAAVNNSLTKFGVFVVVIAACVFAWNSFGPQEYHSPFLWIILGYFTLLTFVVHLLLVKASSRGHQHFIRTFMAATAIKLLTTVAFALVYALFNKAVAVKFIASFLVMYVLFTVFEAAVLTKQLKR